MIITRTPFRISFAGGGSDLKEYYLNHGGAVVSVSIDKYVYLSAHPYFFKDGFLLKYSQHENVDDIEKINHRIIKQVFKDYSMQGIDFNSSADIPSGTGLGSSSAFTVGLINLCNSYKSLYMSKEDIAKAASEVEIEKLGEPIGKQDQYACALGGLNFIEFNSDETVGVEKIIMRKEKLLELGKNLLMFYTGSTRSASEILQKQKQSLLDNTAKVENLHKMVNLAKDLRKELLNNNPDVMGEILHTGWMYKKELNSMSSNETIDYYYNLAMQNGAMGGKILGAGGGGFLLFYVKEENRENVKNALKDLRELDFKFDYAGTSLIYYN